MLFFLFHCCCCYTHTDTHHKNPTHPSRRDEPRPSNLPFLRSEAASTACPTKQRHHRHRRHENTCLLVPRSAVATVQNCLRKGPYGTPLPFMNFCWHKTPRLCTPGAYISIFYGHRTPAFVTWIPSLIFLSGSCRHFSGLSPSSRARLLAQ